MWIDFTGPAFPRAIENDAFVATSIALGLGLAAIGANAATQAYGAHIAGSASKDAAKMQVDAATTAQGRMDAAKKTSDDIYAPYLTAGRTATSTLGRLVSAPPGARYAAPDPTIAAPAPSQPSGPMVGGRPQPPGAPTTGPAVPRVSGTFGAMVPQPRSSAPSGMVMLAANDGSGARPVPRDQAQRYLSTGQFREVA